MPLDTSIPLQVQMPQFAEPVDPATRQYNAMRTQALQQEMMRNQLLIQNTMEDRRREEANRRVAAAQAADERRRLNEYRGILSNFGITPAVTGRRGVSYSGTGVPNDPYAPIQNELLRRGFVPQAEELAKLQKEQLAGEESKAKIPGLQAESSEKQTKAEVAKLDAAVTRYIPAVRGVSTSDDAMRLTDMLYDDPTLGPLLTRVAPREQARAQAAQEFSADPVAFMRRHLLTGKELYEATTAAQKVATPQPTQIDVGGEIKIMDMNSKSPTYMQEVGSLAKTPAPPTAEMGAKEQTKQESKKAVDDTLGRLADEYAALNALGASPSEATSWSSNIVPKLTTSKAGEFFNINPQAQTRVQNIKSLRRSLVQTIKNATGMSAQEMNSNVELQGLLESITDPNQNIESVRTQIQDLSNRYGSGRFATGVPEKNSADTGAKTTFASETEADEYFKQQGAKSGDKFKITIGGQSGTYVVP